MFFGRSCLFLGMPKVCGWKNISLHFPLFFYGRSAWTTWNIFPVTLRYFYTASIYFLRPWKRSLRHESFENEAPKPAEVGKARPVVANFYWGTHQTQEEISRIKARALCEDPRHEQCRQTISEAIAEEFRPFHSLTLCRTLCDSGSVYFITVDLVVRQFLWAAFSLSENHAKDIWVWDRSNATNIWRNITEKLCESPSLLTQNSAFLFA